MKKDFPDSFQYNGVYFIGFDEVWKEINYKDICRNMYEVSNLGRFRKKKSGKILYGCNPKNEKGYCRISLKTVEGKIKKYAMHRIVLYTFDKLDDDREVNHKDGNKLINALFNLEESTRLENAHHAAVNDLYANSERHYRSIFTNEEVERICQMLSDGIPVSNIIKELKLEDRGDIYSNIDKIIHKKSWKSISDKYIFDYKKYHYKTYSYDDIWKMCECIFTKKMKNAEIVELFPQYNRENLKKALKSIRANRVYKTIIKEYMGSTTIES